MEYKHCFNCGCKFHPTRSNQLFCSESCRIKYNKKPYLILPIKKKWFDMILSGEKREEYREIKPYWKTRFQKYYGMLYNTTEVKDVDGNTPKYLWNPQSKIIRFKNGYGKAAPYFDAECTIKEDYGKEEWGAEKGQKYYVLQIKSIMENHKKTVNKNNTSGYKDVSYRKERKQNDEIQIR